MYKRRDWLHVHGPDGGDSSDDDDSSINSDADGVGIVSHLNGPLSPPFPRDGKRDLHALARQGPCTTPLHRRAVAWHGATDEDICGGSFEPAKKSCTISLASS